MKQQIRKFFKLTNFPECSRYDKFVTLVDQRARLIAKQTSTKLFDAAFNLVGDIAIRCLDLNELLMDAGFSWRWLDDLLARFEAKTHPNKRGEFRTIEWILGPLPK